MGYYFVYRSRFASQIHIFSSATVKSAVVGDLIYSMSTRHRRKLVIHLGPHKTGTTYFQSRLSVQGGVSPTLLFPRTCGRPTPPKGFAGLAHAYSDTVPLNLTSAINREITVDEVCNPLSENFTRDFYTSSSDIIISAEYFSTLQQSGFQKLFSDFNTHFDVHVVITRADSRSIFLSLYHNHHKHKPTVSEFSNQIWKQTDNVDNIPPCHFTSVQCVEILSGIFGKERVHVVRK
jgi:hypothetical protein